MFAYSETAKSRWYQGTKSTLRTIEIHAAGEKVGTIEVEYDESGAAIKKSMWGNGKPVEVFEWNAEEQRARTIGYARTVAEGKKIFSDWWAKNGKPRQAGRGADVKYLPTDPNAEFYPTPSALAGQMLALVQWRGVQTILEPSAGKGDLLECARLAWGNKNARISGKFQETVDCVEIDENLRHILSGRGYRVVHDDFLSFDTEKKYDLILMNPPFSDGDRHLLKALDLQKDGGQIVCLLNAETIRNPCTNRRKLLAQKIAEHGATVRFVSGGFSRAQRKTDVKVAIVFFHIPAARRPSFIFDGLTRAAEEQAENTERAPEALVSGDWVEAMVAAFRMEAKAGKALMAEFNALAPHIPARKRFSGEGVAPIITLSIGGNAVSHAGTEAVNSYLRALRGKYWHQMLDRPELSERMTSAMRQEYQEKVAELQDYDFTAWNIRRVIREISAQLCRGVEDSILALFDKLSAEHTWYAGSKNVHYFNGWASNKAHKVNYKVVLPINGYYAWGTEYSFSANKFVGKILDLDRALSYLDGEGAISRIDPDGVAKLAESEGRSTMRFTYFQATFYKKGTCHIKFHPESRILVDRLNIYAARARAWLPPSYGQKQYSAMTPEEQEVIDGFQGREAYESVCKNPERYIIAPAQTMALLTA